MLIEKNPWRLRESPPPLGLTLVFAAVILGLLAIAAVNRSDFIAAIYFYKQDIPILCAMAVALAMGTQVGFGAKWNEPVRLTSTRLFAAAGVLGLLCVAGTFLVLLNFDMSRDEAMASFAASSIGDGSLVTPAPEEWRRYSEALMPNFMHGLSSDSVWISAYLPLNSAFRALVGTILSPAFASPLLLVVGLLALFGVARRLWPDRPDAITVTLLLAMSSPQLIVTAMTSYAMTAHFAANMVWLAFFLRNTPLGHAGALLTGFLAVGLHQLHFHPLFVAPFILWLLARREWWTAIVYLVAYTAICLFWFKVYPGILADLAGASAAPEVIARQGSGAIFSRIERLLEMLPVLWVVNLARFVAWQNMLLLPIAAFSLVVVRRKDWAGKGIALPLLLACLIGLATMIFQGHGWGYRYLHGLIGCFCLLAGYGWQQIMPADAPSRAWAVFKYALAVTLLVLLPIQLTMAHVFVAPHARLYRAMKSAPVDVVLVDPRGGLYAEDLVQNSADRDDLPKIMDLGLLTPANLDALCGSKRVALVDERHYRAIGIPHVGVKDPLYDGIGSLRASVDARRCATPLRLD